MGQLPSSLAAVRQCGGGGSERQSHHRDCARSELKKLPGRAPNPTEAADGGSAWDSAADAKAKT